MEPSRRATRCSIIDSTLQFVTPSMAFGYRERLDPGRLREALAHVLDDFASYAGRLVRRGAEVYIEPRVAGALVEAAVSSESTAALALAARVKHSDAVCPSISVVGIARGNAPLFAVRLTHTSDGSVLGVSWNHALGDGYSTMLLLRAWALAYRGQPYERPFEVSDRAAYLAEHLPAPASDALGHRVLPWSEFARCCHYHYWQTGAARRVKLDFAWDDISELHAAAAPGASVSREDTLAAHLFLSIRRAQGMQSSSQMTNAINYRKRLGLPANLLGNMSDMVSTTANLWDDTATVATALRRSIEALGTGPMAHRDYARLQAMYPRAHDRVRFWNSGCHPCRTNLHLNNVVGLKQDELVFEAEKPVFVHFRSSNMSIGPAIGQGTVYRRLGNAGLSFDLLMPAQVARRLEAEQQRSPLEVMRENERRVSRRPGPAHRAA